MNAEEAIAAVLAIVDNMAARRSDLMEEAVKEINRRLSVVRQQVGDEMDLEKKLAFYKDQRALEHIRAERRNRMFELIDDGAIYASAPLEQHELEALVKPLREFVTHNDQPHPVCSLGPDDVLLVARANAEVTGLPGKGG